MSSLGVNPSVLSFLAWPSGKKTSVLLDEFTTCKSQCFVTIVSMAIWTENRSVLLDEFTWCKSQCIVIIVSKAIWTETFDEVFCGDTWCNG